MYLSTHQWKLECSETDGHLPNGSYQGYSLALWWGIVNCLPNGSYQLTGCTQLVISSMVVPMEWASGSGPFMVTLPMEVVTVSMYVMPIISSFTMQLELMLEIPRVATSLMGLVPTGALRSTSMSSGVCKQAVTPEKPCGWVGGCTNARACVGRESWGGVGSSEGGLAVLLVSFRRVGLIPFSALGLWSVGGSLWQPPLVEMDVMIFPIPGTSGLSLPEQAQVHSVS